ncbi:hypothetical protein [Corticicoccus populi]|uniref:Phage protein n=1 Tax=Corticicoccus populi TaxID=1812821 RepID=A0ABW5WR00_9STAP
MKHYEIENESEMHELIIEYIECVYTYEELDEDEYQIAYFEAENNIKDELENG